MPRLAVDTVEDYEELAATVEMAVQHLLARHNYDSVGNLLRFYREYRKSGGGSVRHFYRRYRPVVTPEHHTCVGLALELVARLAALDGRFPGLGETLHLVSCEEAIDDLADYVREQPRDQPSPTTTEKEHVLVSVRVHVAGRPGILLLDPGYHVARVVTVMADQLYPHTGWFVQADGPRSRREYGYSFASPHTDYVVWLERESRPARPEKISAGVLYVGRPFLSPVDVTERRNLVYDFRSLLARDTKGTLLAGVYFKIHHTPAEPPQFTLFYAEPGAAEPRRTKIPFGNIREHAEDVSACGSQLAFPPGRLEAMLGGVGSMLDDVTFRTQLLSINSDIADMAGEA